MASENVARIIRAPGQLIVNPTTSFATTAFPYGGTELGLVKIVSVLPRGVPFRIECEGLGEASDILEPNREYAVSFILRGWDDDVVANLLAQSFVAGATTRHAVYRAPDNVPGASSIGRAAILAYIPDDVIHAPGLLAYRAIVDWDEGIELTFDRQNEVQLELRADLLRDGSGSMLKVGRIQDLVLS